MTAPQTRFLQRKKDGACNREVEDDSESTDAVEDAWRGRMDTFPFVLPVFRVVEREDFGGISA